METIMLKGKPIRNTVGFTLIEILIVVMVLGILAMVIIPQITVSTEDAKESTLATNISILRNAIEIYYHQHDSVYPTDTDFIEQLTQFTTIDGTVSATETATAKYGPYLKSQTLPVNPFMVLDADRTTVKFNTAETSLANAPKSDGSSTDGTTAWLFYTKLGILVANDGDHDDL